MAQSGRRKRAFVGYLPRLSLIVRATEADTQRRSGSHAPMLTVALADPALKPPLAGDMARDQLTDGAVQLTGTVTVDATVTPFAWT